MLSTVEEITQRAAYLDRERASFERRLANATRAGADLAAEVTRYLDDPEGVGTDALYKANGRFLSLHAGNFTLDEGAVDDLSA